MSDILWDICKQKYFPLNLRIRSANTHKQYQIALNCFGRFLGRPPTLADLDDDTVTMWMSSLLSADPPLGVATIRERVGRPLALWTWLAKKGLLGKFPTVVKPEPADTMPQALTQEQLRALFASASRERGDVAGIPAAVWWSSYLGFVWCTAERKGAALAVQTAWIDLTGQFAKIPPASRKGRRKWGVYPLWPELIPLLRQCLAATGPRELVWPWPKCEGSYYTSYNRILRDAGIPVTRQTKTHSLRVSHATWLKVMGGDPTRKLGHSSPATTDKHYLDPTKMPDTQPRLFVPWQPPAA